MEKQIKPENLFIARKRWLTAIAAAAFLAVGIALAVAFPLAVIKYLPSDDLRIYLIVCAVLLTAESLYLGVLNLRNLFFPYILTADEKGVYNYSGFFHFGFVAWQEIGGFTKEAAVLDMLDSDTPSIKIYLKNFKAFKRKQSFYRKWLLFWSLGEIKIHTLCSQIPRKQLLTLLCDMLVYYSHPEQVNNG